MNFKTVIFLSCVTFCECVYVYSSFWAPLFDPRILNYRVEAPFPPEAGKNARETYENNYGYRGETLVSDLGIGRAPTHHDQVPTDIHLVQQYPGAGRTLP